MKAKIDEEWFSAAVAEDMLWHAENAQCAKVRKAALRMAFYYMTYSQVDQYLGSKEAAEEYFNEY